MSALASMATAAFNGALPIATPLIGLAILIGGITWALLDSNHGKMKVVGALIGGAVAFNAQLITTGLQALH